MRIRKTLISVPPVRYLTCGSVVQLMDEEIRRRIWTCLEFTIRHHTSLMRDRHLDQLIMCSLYIVCKVREYTQYTLYRHLDQLIMCSLYLSSRGSRYTGVCRIPNSEAETFRLYLRALYWGLTLYWSTGMRFQT